MNTFEDRMTLTVERLIWGGRGLARLPSGQRAIVAPGMLPGETAECQIVLRKKDHIEVRPEKLIDPSPLRRPHPCPAAETCGGCAFGVMPVAHQLACKDAILRDALSRQLKHHLPPDLVINLLVGSKSWRYRWRGQIHVRSGKPHFMGGSSHDLVSTNDCLLFATPLAKALPKLASTLPDGRFVVAASPKDGKAATERDASFIHLPFLDAGFDLALPPRSFFQANWALNQQLIARVRDELKHIPRIADLFSGAGNFALPLARDGHQVLAVENDPLAAKACMEAATRFVLSSITCKNADLSRPQAWQDVINFKPKAAVVDPPRSGAKTLFEALQRIPSLKTLVWISCDVVNSCRDLMPLLASGWQLTEVLHVEMFPQTWHLEVVFVLKKA